MADLYEIRLQGHLDAHWTTWFEGLAVAHAEDGTTVLSGPVADQAALFGLLERVRDLGLPLLAVQRIELNKGGKT
jgi:hypothetical protein